MPSFYCDIFDNDICVKSYTFEFKFLSKRFFFEMLNKSTCFVLFRIDVPTFKKVTGNTSKCLKLIKF